MNNETFSLLDETLDGTLDGTDYYDPKSLGI